MRVAIVHDDLVQWGGAERVLEAICGIYPDAPIYTSVYDSSNEQLSQRFGSKKIYTSFLQKIPGWKPLYKPLYPLHPIAFEQFSFGGYDLVISHTTRFAKSVITKPQTVHVSYCHTPPRFLWNFSGEKYFGLSNILFTKQRIYDRVSAQRVDHFLAGSKNARSRIKRVYQMDSQVVYPFVDLKRFENVETFDGGYFVIIARLNKYKRVDLAVDACMELGMPLKVIGTGPEVSNLRVKSLESRIKGEVEFLENIDDEAVVQTLAGCRALIVPGIEDFGITPLEAQALGKLVIAYKVGGVLETVIDGKTGIFFNEQTVESLMAAILKLENANLNPQDCQDNALRFSKERFTVNFKQAINSLV